MNTDKNRLLRLAEQEDGCPLWVGGLFMRAATEPRVAEPSPANRLAFAKFVQLSRRRLRMTVEELAQRADVGVDDIVSIEEGCDQPPEPRSIYKLATVLKVPQARLMELSGLAEPRDPSLQKAAIKFAAQSEPMEKLSPAEANALEELIKVLAERTDGR
jgi:transcriptional regulator with XRE-family HTH domain